MNSDYPLGSTVLFTSAGRTGQVVSDRPGRDVRDRHVTVCWHGCLPTETSCIDPVELEIVTHAS